MTHRVLTFNGKCNDFTLIDAKTGNDDQRLGAVGGKPEFCQVDGKGHVFANLEDKNESHRDQRAGRSGHEALFDRSLYGPSGLAIDVAKMHLSSRFAT